MDMVLKRPAGGPSLCARCERSRRAPRVRRLHEGSLELGPKAEEDSHSTTHRQSFGGVSASGQRLLFKLRDPSFPSQHRSDLSLTEETSEPPQSHSRDVHAPQHVTARPDQSRTLWAWHMSGGGARELLSDPQTGAEGLTGRSDGERPEREAPEREAPERRWGRPTHWHQHDIITGENLEENPVRSCRRTRDKHLWPSRRRDTDPCAFRLY